jgi:general secretion pathway protein B
VVVSAPPAVPSREPPALLAAPPAEGARPPGAPIITQVRRLAELPAEQRRELPPLVVGGSVWSDQASARFVVLDGQVLREGDAAAPGLVLVKLAPRAATLRWRDMLLELPL